MNDKFDELAKNMAQSATRRQALRGFGVGLVALTLASLGRARAAQPQIKPSSPCPNCHNPEKGCAKLYPIGSGAYVGCVATCQQLIAMGACH